MIASITATSVVSSLLLFVSAAVPSAITGMLHWLEEDFSTTWGILLSHTHTLQYLLYLEIEHKFCEQHGYFASPYIGERILSFIFFV